MPSLFRYVALGDSSGVGIGADADGGYPERLYTMLKSRGVPAGILNLAQSGAQSADVLRAQAPRAASKQPHLVTLGIGGNDLWRLVPEETFAANVGAIADLLEASGAHVVVCNLADLGYAPVAKTAHAWLGITPRQISERVTRFNAHLAKLARRPRFEVVDLFSASHHELRTDNPYFCADGFHPSAQGYDRWADLCWPAVNRAVERQLAAT